MICKIEFSRALWRLTLPPFSQDDKLKIPRQNLPEFCYEYHLELFFDPVLAEEAIVNLIANTKFYAEDSPRARMFGRCLPSRLVSCISCCTGWLAHASSHLTPLRAD
jgi:hypothetical protein